MSSQQRLSFDEATYANKMRETTTPHGYIMDPVRFEHCQKCRHEFGLVGGANVSHNATNLVDIETELRGQSRTATKCPSGEFPHKQLPISETKLHLPACQMIKYPPLVVPQLPPIQSCGNDYLRWGRK
jgi:hypothetical protein